MLTKTTREVYHAGVTSYPAQAYSRTCPPPIPPTPPKRWVTKTVCGNYSKYGFGAYDHTGAAIIVYQTVYVLPGMPPTTTVVPSYDPTKPTTTPELIGTGPYCTKVTVYE